MPAKPGLYLNTIRHLQPRQVAYLAARPIRRLMARPRRDSGSVLAEYRVPTLRRALCAGARNDIETACANANRVLIGEFRFIGESRSLTAVDWSARYGSPLWSFHLQYGEYIEELARAYDHTGDRRYLTRLEELVDSWIVHKKGVTSDAWAPYAVARRLVHWLRAFLLCEQRLGSAFRARWAGSLAMQTRYLAHNVEWHLLANHVQKNLHAVYCCAALFAGDRFGTLRRQAGRLLWRESEEQVLDDGMHYERSPMYHAHVYADYLEARAVGRALNDMLPPELDARLTAMETALGRFIRPDGSLRLFNDAADSENHSAQWLADVRSGTAMPPGGWELRDAGYYSLAAGQLTLIIDCGEPGPSYQPAHGHCDLLSFELDMDGEPFVVDSGTSGYDGDPLREYIRSTRAHNTVQIGDYDQHEVWGTFRMARRARVGPASLDIAAGRFSGSYSPYFSQVARHHRTASLSARMLRIEDYVAGTNGAVVRSFIHLHPSWEALMDGRRILLSRDTHRARIEPYNVAAVRIAAGERSPAQGWYAPRFGMRQPAPAVVMTVADAARPFGYTITML